jgi:hypothetical protein
VLGVDDDIAEVVLQSAVALAPALNPIIRDHILALHLQELEMA